MAILIQFANGVPGVKFSLDSDEITIGRALENDISIDDEFVSKKHAVIQLMTDELTSRVDCILIDNNSTNHIYVNNVQVSAHRLEENDWINIGQNEFRFSFESIDMGPVANAEHIISDFTSAEAASLLSARAKVDTKPIPHSNNQSNFSSIPLDGYDVEDLSATKHQLDTNAVDEHSDSQKDNSNKRFSRRLTFI